MVISEFDDLTIRHVTEASDVARWRAGFIGAYQTVFSDAPYYERFFPSEAEGIYRKLTSTPGNITILVTRGSSQVVAFGIGVPLRFKTDVCRELEGLVPTRHTFYLAELGVLPQYRDRTLGRTLVSERLRRIEHSQYTHVLLRISLNNMTSSKIYTQLDFEDMGVYMDVRAMRTNGKVTTDRRFFMSRVLSQVELTE